MTNKQKNPSKYWTEWISSLSIRNPNLNPHEHDAIFMDKEVVRLRKLVGRLEKQNGK